MKKIKNLFKAQVLCLLFATIISAVLVVTNYANYKKTTANYDEKVIGERIEVEKISEDYISFFDTIGTETTYYIIYEYEWQGKTYQTEVKKGFFGLIDYLDYGTKIVCYINAENPNDAVVNAFYPVTIPIILFAVFFISFILVATYFLFDSEKDRIVPMKDKREVICTCPYCKSENVGVKDFLSDKTGIAGYKKIWAYCMICGRRSDKREVPIETSDDDIIELATAEWRSREKKLSLDELEALYLGRYIRKKDNKVSEDDVENFIEWCRNNI